MYRLRNYAVDRIRACFEQMFLSPRCGDQHKTRIKTIKLGLPFDLFCTISVLCEQLLYSCGPSC